MSDAAAYLVALAAGMAACYGWAWVTYWRFKDRVYPPLSEVDWMLWTLAGWAVIVVVTLTVIAGVLT